MTDTAKAKSTGKPLVWDDAPKRSYGDQINIHYCIILIAGVWHVVDEGLNGPFETRELAKAACQADYEACTLSALDLTAHDAAVRAEALERVATRADQVWHASYKTAIRSMNRNGPWWQIQKRQKEFCEFIRALAEQGGK